jgi:hypothetical protein
MTKAEWREISFYEKVMLQISNFYDKHLIKIIFICLGISAVLVGIFVDFNIMINLELSLEGLILICAVPFLIFMCCLFLEALND